ncbi:unnamed protein product [Aureobasidium pullulans]|nr:unnamed protein product [Aureobasidium pullulans]CAD0015239.1 unnamed protein product [Aureobasidium pullulans]
MAWEVSGNVALPTIGQTFDAQATSSVPASATSGATGTRASSSGSRSTGSSTGTGAAASASQTGMASPSRQIAGMSVGLVTVMLGFIWWL